MEIERKGGGCIVITIKKSKFVFDPKLSEYGLKDQGAGATAIILTQPEYGVPAGQGSVVIDGPGEYEVQNCSVNGTAVRAHSKPEDAPKTVTMYRLEADDCSVAVLGNTHGELTQEELEALGVVDILVLPVGGYGLTLEPKEAVSLVRTIEPKVVIPTHYQEEDVKYPVPQAPVAEFVTELGATHEPTAKLKVKAGALPETLTVYELTRTK